LEEGGREGGREAGREGGREGEREREREREVYSQSNRWLKVGGCILIFLEGHIYCFAYPASRWLDLRESAFCRGEAGGAGGEEGL
jgi:hypothetical protein